MTKPNLISGVMFGIHSFYTLIAIKVLYDKFLQDDNPLNEAH